VKGKGLEQIRARPRNKIVYAGKVFKVGVKKLTLSGHTLDYGTVLAGKVAAVLPILEDGRLLLEYNYRDTVNRWVYEIPAGHIDKGESPRHAAARELEEETGYKAKRVRFLFRSLASPGMSDEEMYLFLATDLVKGRQKREIFERIRLKPMTLEKALGLIRKHEADVKTISAILFYKGFIYRHKGRG
jgi:ADP-ribose pyrophosphatase